MKGRKEVSKSCPECGGDLKWNSLQKVYICSSCGLELTEQERMLYEYKEREGKDEIKEYVDWWLSKKE